MDQLWRGLKDKISANYQFSEIDEHAAWAEEWLSSLTRGEALLKAGVLSKNYYSGNEVFLLAKLTEHKRFQRVARMNYQRTSFPEY
jgi:hypothetical protein